MSAVSDLLKGGASQAPAQQFHGSAVSKLLTPAPSAPAAKPSPAPASPNWWERVKGAAADTASFGKAILSPVQGAINTVRDIPALAYGAIGSVTPGHTLKGNIEQYNKVVPQASFADRGTQELADKGIVPKAAGNIVNQGGQIAGGLAVPLPGGGEVKALEELPAAVKFGANTLLRGGEGSLIGGGFGLAGNGDLNEAKKGAEQGFAVGAGGNIGFSALGSLLGRFHSLPVHDVPATAYDSVPETKVTSPADLETRLNTLESKGMKPDAAVPLADGGLGVSVKDAATGETSLHKFTAPAPEDAKLPAELSGAKPKYRDYSPQFANDVDKAAYIVAQAKPSAKDADYLKFLTDSTGMSDEQARSYGKEVRASVKDAATGAEPGAIKVPAGNHAKALGQDVNLADLQNQGGRPPEQNSLEAAVNHARETGSPADWQAAQAALDSQPQDYKDSMGSLFEDEIKSGIQVSPETPVPLANGGNNPSTGAPVGAVSDLLKNSKLAERQGSEVRYQGMDQAATVKQAADFATANPEEAKAIIAGTAPERDGVTSQALYAAAANSGDTELQRAAANSHTLAATEAGQRVSLYGSVEQDNPTKIMGNVRNARAEALGGEEKVSGKIESESGKIKASIKETPVTQSDWQEFLKSLPAGETNNKFLQALKDGKIDPQALKDMTSAERNSFLEKYVGKDSAQKVNALFESKTLLKNQQKGMEAWAKTAAGLKPDVRRDLIASIERLDTVLTPESEKSFLADLAGQRLGVNVTSEEATKISQLADTMNALKEQNPNSIEYGRSRVALDNYVKELKQDAARPKGVGGVISDVAGLQKSLKATADNSALFRQGWKTLLTHPGIWADNAIKSFGDLVKSYGGKEVMDETNAEIYSRPTFDKMKKAGVAINTGEEAFPHSKLSTLVEKIPVAGKIYKASEAAYEAFITRTRADLFDKYLKIAQDTGVDTNDKAQLQGIGHLVNSLTGRGKLGALEKSAGAINNVLFSPRFAKSNFDVLTSHVFDSGATAFTKKQAAVNLLKIISGTAVVLGTAKALNPDSVELDPRSSDFGKIKIGDTRFDVSGGMASIVTLAARLLAHSSKSTTTGKVTQLDDPNAFGGQTTTDVVSNYLTGKLSPAAAMILQLREGHDANGNANTVGGVAANAFEPLPISNYQELSNDPNAANKFLSAIADGLGISTNTYDQGQSKPGNAGLQAKATQAFVQGDEAGARKIISDNYPPEKQAAALEQAATAAAGFSKRAKDQTVDFYSAYHNVSSARDKASKQVTQLVQQGKRAQAQRVAREFNATVPGQFSGYASQYGEPSGDAAKLLKGLDISVSPSSFKSRSKVASPLSF